MRRPASAIAQAPLGQSFPSRSSAVTPGTAATARSRAVRKQSTWASTTGLFHPPTGCATRTTTRLPPFGPSARNRGNQRGFISFVPFRVAGMAPLAVNLGRREEAAAEDDQGHVGLELRGVGLPVLGAVAAVVRPAVERPHRDDAFEKAAIADSALGDECVRLKRPHPLAERDGHRVAHDQNAQRSFRELARGGEDSPLRLRPRLCRPRLRRFAGAWGGAEPKRRNRQDGREWNDRQSIAKSVATNRVLDESIRGDGHGGGRGEAKGREANAVEMRPLLGEPDEDRPMPQIDAVADQADAAERSERERSGDEAARRRPRRRSATSPAISVSQKPPR